jgi:hypothetical protein
VDYDPQRKQFTRTPTLPPTALPRPSQSVRLAPPPPAAKEVASRPSSLLPANGAELQKRLYDYDARLAKQGLIKAGELVKHIVAAGVKAGYEADLAAWAGPAIQLAVEETRAFEARARQKSPEKKEVA